VGSLGAAAHSDVHAGRGYLPQMRRILHRGESKLQAGCGGHSWILHVQASGAIIHDLTFMRNHSRLSGMRSLEGFAVAGLVHVCFLLRHSDK
jgi:hypothetical protein